eukprot:8364306-Pyramimonas_sp.AAC.1
MNRIDEHVRTRVQKVELEASLVRRRLLRSTLQAIVARPSQTSAPSACPPPPPAPSTVAFFGSSHRLSACGKKCE